MATVKTLRGDDRPLHRIRGASAGGRPAKCDAAARLTGQSTFESVLAVVPRARGRAYPRLGSTRSARSRVSTANVHAAGGALRTRSVRPRALGGNCGWSRKPTVLRHPLDDTDQICLAVQPSEGDVTAEVLDCAKTPEVGRPSRFRSDRFDSKCHREHLAKAKLGVYGPNFIWLRGAS